MLRAQPNRMPSVLGPPYSYGTMEDDLADLMQVRSSRACYNVGVFDNNSTCAPIGSALFEIPALAVPRKQNAGIDCLTIVEPYQRSSLPNGTTSSFPSNQNGAEDSRGSSLFLTSPDTVLECPGDQLGKLPNCGSNMAQESTGCFLLIDGEDTATVPNAGFPAARPLSGLNIETEQSEIISETSLISPSTDTPGFSL